METLDTSKVGNYIDFASSLLLCTDEKATITFIFSLFQSKFEMSSQCNCIFIIFYSRNVRELKHKKYIFGSQGCFIQKLLAHISYALTNQRIFCAYFGIFVFLIFMHNFTGFFCKFWNFCNTFFKILPFLKKGRKSASVHRLHSAPYWRNMKRN